MTGIAPAGSLAAGIGYTASIKAGGAAIRVRAAAAVGGGKRG